MIKSNLFFSRATIIFCRNLNLASFEREAKSHVVLQHIYLLFSIKVKDNNNKIVLSHFKVFAEIELGMAAKNSVKGETLITAFDLGHKIIWIYTEKVDSSSLLQKAGHTYLNRDRGKQRGTLLERISQTYSSTIWQISDGLQLRRHISLFSAFSRHG